MVLWILDDSNIPYPVRSYLYFNAKNTVFTIQLVAFINAYNKINIGGAQNMSRYDSKVEKDSGKMVKPRLCFGCRNRVFWLAVKRYMQSELYCIY